MKDVTCKHNSQLNKQENAYSSKVGNPEKCHSQKIYDIFYVLGIDTM